MRARQEKPAFFYIIESVNDGMLKQCVEVG